MKIILLILSTLILIFKTYSQSVSDVVKKLGASPLLFVDSQEVDISTIGDYNPLDIAHVHIHLGRKLKKIIGERGEDGGIYVTTNKKAREVYWNYFALKSKYYKNLIPTLQEDTTIQYILNGKILPRHSEGSLYQIANKKFKVEKTINIVTAANIRAFVQLGLMNMFPAS